MIKELSFIALLLSAPQVSAQSILHRADSMLSRNYRKGDIDTAYITRPSTMRGCLYTTKKIGCQSILSLAADLN